MTREVLIKSRNFVVFKRKSCISSMQMAYGGF